MEINPYEPPASQSDSPDIWPKSTIGTICTITGDQMRDVLEYVACSPCRVIIGAGAGIASMAMAPESGPQIIAGSTAIYLLVKAFREYCFGQNDKDTLKELGGNPDDRFLPHSRGWLQKEIENRRNGQ